MILYKRAEGDKSGRLEEMKIFDLPSEGLVLTIGDIVNNIRSFGVLAKGDTFFIVFSKEEEIKLLDPLKLFSTNPISSLTTIFNGFFREMFCSNVPFLSFFCINDSVINPITDENIEPSLGICIPFVN